MNLPIRMRRLRQSESMRRLVRSVHLSADNFIYPLFVCPGKGIKQPIDSMSECFHYSPDAAAAEAKKIYELGLPAILLFGLPAKKDSQGLEAYDDKAAVQQAIGEIKKAVPGLLVITDVCLCAYTDSGHCGIIKDGKIDNDTSCEILAKTAVSHAKAGADMVAPSDMMDGRVGEIREALDENGFTDTAIMAYSAKYASAFYGPFRGAAESAPAFGDRKTYQMDTASSAAQAMREIELDINEGADIVMVKPAMTNLDIISEAKKRFDVPIAAYQVSGEYMMINVAAAHGVIDRQAAIMESLTAIKRSGADIIISYFAKDVVKWITK
ncbi:MAG: porphobilinogen synthase [Phycisphaerales bacterium]